MLNTSVVTFLVHSKELTSNDPGESHHQEVCLGDGGYWSQATLVTQRAVVRNFQKHGQSCLIVTSYYLHVELIIAPFGNMLC